jgi:hypothetical protein
VTKDQCVDSNGKAQDLRKTGKFKAARAELQTCASTSCPAIVRDDCARRLDELVKAQPSLLFDVKDGKGADVIDVRVSADGAVVAEHLDGSPINVDPGVHVFTFVVAGYPEVTAKLLLREGEAGRRERITLGDAAASQKPAAAPATQSTAQAPAPGGMGTQKTVGLVLGGVGVVGVGIGTVFGLFASSAWSDATSACGGNTSACVDQASGRSHHDTAVTDGTISTVGFIAGGALLAGGAVLFFTGRRASEDGAPRGVSLVPTVAPGHGKLSLVGAF